MFNTGKTQADYDLEQAKNDALQYLKDTDWYAVRKNETGKDDQPEITVKRAEARLIL